LTARFQQIDLPERVPRSVDGAEQPDARRPHKRETAKGTCASPYPASSFWRCRITHINPPGGNPSARTMCAAGASRSGTRATTRKCASPSR
jgi:hypothetical protein